MEFEGLQLTFERGKAIKKGKQSGLLPEFISEFIFLNFRFRSCSFWLLYVLKELFKLRMRNQREKLDRCHQMEVLILKL